MVRLLRSIVSVGGWCSRVVCGATPSRLTRAGGAVLRLPGLDARELLVVAEPAAEARQGGALPLGEVELGAQELGVGEVGRGHVGVREVGVLELRGHEARAGSARVT